ncbi:MAG: HAD-IA family hydrolase [Phycisphaera sp.]|nr:HAD-IA family hydrolase [Phycisphaera sp.]
MSGSIRAILFDLGDTLIQYGQIDHAQLFEIAARRTYRLWSRNQKRMPGYRRYYLHQWFAMHWGFLKMKLLRREMSAMRYIRRASRKLWLDAQDDGFYEELAWNWYKPLADVSHIEPDTVATIQLLRERGYRLGIVSNTFVPGFVLDRHLEMLGLLDAFPVRVYSCDVGYRKPDPRIFEEALRLLDVGPAEAIFIGDLLDADIHGSQRVGMVPILKRAADATYPSPPVHEEVPVIRTLGELPELIDRIEESRSHRLQIKQHRA